MDITFIILKKHKKIKNCLKEFVTNYTDYREFYAKVYLDKTKEKVGVE